MRVSGQPARPHRDPGDFGSRISPVRSSIVAVVDDDEDVRDVLSTLFVVCGHEVETYKSGIEFLQKAEFDSLACLVVDLRMPQMTGLELTAELENRGLAIPTVLITGESPATVRKQAASSGLMAVMQKPMSHYELLRFVAISVR
jgi:FixJ family two-component response regulator